MKKLGVLIVILIAVLFGSCEKDEIIEMYDLNFVRLEYDKTNSSVEIKEILVGYMEILAYDSAQHLFQLDDSAWERIKSKITPIYPDPIFDFGVTVNSELIYKASFIPGYYSYSYPEVIKFNVIDPNYIFLWKDNYIGNEDVNDDRIIEILSKDGKLKSIEL